MPEVDINDLDKLGVIRDEPAYQIPPEAFDRLENMRVVDGGLERMKGDEQVFGTPPIAPHFALTISAPAQNFWLYTSLAAAYVYDGASHTKVTRQSAGVDVPYTATNTRDWNGTIIGGIPILNNGLDIPQYWAAPTTGTKLANLTNWPTNLRAKRVVAFGAYLVAVNITDGANVYPHEVRWSTEAPGPGSLPASWDYADETLDTGAYDLPDVNSGQLVDALPLGGKLVLYKEQSTWTMRFVGGRAIFAFDTLFETVGILAPRCVAVTPDGVNHVVATQDDLVIHNGQGKPASILNKRLRRAVFNDLDTDNFRNSFCFTDSENSEVWFCYPQQGQTHPNRAVVFNQKSGAVTEADVASFRNVAQGVIEESSDEVWDTGTESWDTGSETWSTAKRRELVLLDPANTKFRQANQGLLRNGASFPATVQRTSLSVLGKKRSGEWIVDHQIMKFVDRMWPKIQGGPVRVRIGFQQYVNGPVTWSPYTVFDPSTMVLADFEPGCGRAVSVEFSTIDAVDWRIDGYKIAVDPSGEF